MSENAGRATPFADLDINEEAEPSDLEVATDSGEQQKKKKPKAKPKRKGKKKKKKKASPKTAYATSTASSTPASRTTTASASAQNHRSADASPGQHSSVARSNTSRPSAVGGGEQFPLAATGLVSDFRAELGASSTVSDTTGVVPHDRERHEKLAEASRQRKQAKESKQRRDAARAAKQAKLQRAKQAKTAKRVTARLTDAKDYTFIHKQRFDSANGVKIDDRPPDVMSLDEIARRDAKMARVSAQRNNDVFLSKIDRYTSQKHARAQAAQAKFKEMEKHRHGMVVDPVHNPTVPIPQNAFCCPLMIFHW